MKTIDNRVSRISEEKDGFLFEIYSSVEDTVGFDLRMVLFGTYLLVNIESSFWERFT